jgi:dimethylglycine dehydrogenase
MGDLTTMRVTEDAFWICGSGYLQQWHMRWFTEQLDGEPDVHIENISDTMGGIAIAGPRARDILMQTTAVDVSNAAFPFVSVRAVDLGFSPATVARLSVTGELGYEIYVPATHLPSLYQSLGPAMLMAGARDIGMYALNSLRLEKQIGIWSREYSRDYTPRMARLDRFIDYERKEFIGMDAALRDRDAVPSHRLVTLALDEGDADVSGYEPVTYGNKLVGFVTSGGFGHYSGISLAMGYVDSAVSEKEGDLRVTVLGRSRSCRILPNAAFDPEGSRLRG